MTMNGEHVVSRETIDRIIGEALVNPRFCAVLLSDPGEVADLLDLSPEERQLLSNLRAGSLEELATQLYNEVRKRGGDDLSKLDRPF